MSTFTKERVDAVWNSSLFEAFAHRRTFRYPRGCEITEAPYVFKSDKEPVALTELEQAILCWAGHGVTGTIMSDLNAAAHVMNNWIGRTHPNPCNDQKQELLFIDDTGVYLYRPAGPKGNVEFQTPEDRIKIVDSYKGSLVKMIDGRPNFHEFGLAVSNHWNANKPGTTTFMPVIDITYEYINFVVSSITDDHWQFYDDRNGSPAGIKKWIDNGYLNGPAVPLTYLEIGVSSACTATAHYMIQNIGLAAAAMGLGAYPYGGYVSLILMGGTPLSPGFGFRFKTGKDKMPTPVGKDGFIEPLCQPYVKDMGEAVDRFWEWKFGPTGMFGDEYDGPRPWKDKDMYKRVRKPSEEDKEIVKAFLNYINDTYGRFPAIYDAVQMPVALSVHHPELDFYEKYYPKEAVTDLMRQHMKTWHGKE